MDLKKRSLIVLEEKSLKDFLENEPDIYSIKNIKAKTKGN
jgi:hypothetical protein